MLLDPGGTVPFNGQTLTYPDIRLVSTWNVTVQRAAAAKIDLPDFQTF